MNGLARPASAIYQSLEALGAPEPLAPRFARHAASMSRRSSAVSSTFATPRGSPPGDGSFVVPGMGTIAGLPGEEPGEGELGRGRTLLPGDFAEQVD